MSATRERTMWERVEQLVIEALARQQAFAEGTMVIEPNSEQVTRAILARLREPDAAMVLAVEREMEAQYHACPGQELMRQDGRAVIRAAIDAIREDAQEPAEGSPDDDTKGRG